MPETDLQTYKFPSCHFDTRVLTHTLHSHTAGARDTKGTASGNSMGGNLKNKTVGLGLLGSSCSWQQASYVNISVILR